MTKNTKTTRCTWPAKSTDHGLIARGSRQKSPPVADHNTLRCLFLLLLQSTGPLKRDARETRLLQFRLVSVTCSRGWLSHGHQRNARRQVGSVRLQSSTSCGNENPVPGTHHRVLAYVDTRGGSLSVSMCVLGTSWS